jgi:hypothetical protein
VLQREHLGIAVAGDRDRRDCHGARRRPLAPAVGVQLGPDLGFETSVHACPPVGRPANLTLFTMEVRSRSRPRVRREPEERRVKIPGYSAYLHPIADGFVFGIGQDANELLTYVFASSHA